MIIWPFKPRETVREQNEWMTDVIQSKGREQRWAMRLVPRQSFTYAHTLTHEQYVAARGIIKSADEDETLYMPDWTLAKRIGAVSVESYGAQLTYDGYTYQPSIGDKLILWESEDVYDVCTIIETDSADVITVDSITNDYEDAYAMPLRSVLCEDGMDASITVDDYVRVSIEFLCTDSIDYGDTVYPTYQGDEFIDEPPVIADARFSENLEQEFSDVDFGVSYPVLLNKRTLPKALHSMRWHVFNEADLLNLRKFVHTRRGKWKSFWMQSYKDDFELAETLGAASSTVKVFAPAGVTNLGMNSFDIRINDAYNRRVNTYVSSTLNGETVLEFTIDSVTGVEVPAGSKVSYLRHVRFNADRILFRHQAASGVTCQVQLIEVNQ